MSVMETLETLYFDWLCAKVIDTTSLEYQDLLEILYKTEFIWVVPMDENRAFDGRELRYYYAEETGNKEPDREAPASVLEVLISFANRAEFQTDIPERDWFWIFIDNLGLKEYQHISGSDVPVVEGIIQKFLWRKYDSHGFGGLFPMPNTQNDQRKKEIWTQFCEYILER